MQPSERITFAGVPEIQTTCDSHDTKGLSITTHLDSSVLWRPLAACRPAQYVCEKIFTFSHSVRYSNIKALLSAGNAQTKTPSKIFIATSSPLKQAGAVYKRFNQNPD